MCRNANCVTPFFYTHTVLTAMFTLLIYASYKDVFTDLHIL